MARSKYLSLEEARKAKCLDRFAKEHPFEDVHPRARSRFKAVLNAMSRGTLEGGQTSSRGSSASYSGTRTRQGTSGDTSG